MLICGHLCKITSYLIQLIADKLLIRLCESNSFRFISLVLIWRWLCRSEYKLQARALRRSCERKTFIHGSSCYITIMVWKCIMSKFDIRSILFDYRLPVRSSVQRLMQYFLLWSLLPFLMRVNSWFVRILCLACWQLRVVKVKTLSF